MAAYVMAAAMTAERRRDMTDTERLKRSLRLIKMRDLFRAGWRGTSYELAERYGVSQRTIQRDLADLQLPDFELPLVVEVVWQVMPERG